MFDKPNYFEAILSLIFGKIKYVKDEIVTLQGQETRYVTPLPIRPTVPNVLPHQPFLHNRNNDKVPFTTKVHAIPISSIKVQTRLVYLISTANI